MIQPPSWPEVLPKLQAGLNGSSSTTTGRTPYDIAYGFEPNQALDLVKVTHKSADFDLKVVARKEASDAISFATMTQKFYYDRKHQPMFFKPGDEVLLRLHKGVISLPPLLPEENTVNSTRIPLRSAIG